MYQTRWYLPFHVDLVIDSSPFNWFGPLIGFVDSSLATPMDKMIIQIKTSTFEYYIHFNRASGMNADTSTAPDEVMVMKMATGTSYGISYFLAALSNAPGSNTYTIPFFNGNSNTLTITVYITLGPGPWRAWVSINL
jgi:hypothetical protein